MTLTHQINRRLALALVASASLFSSVGIAAADKIKVAAIYTLPVEQQWISRIHKALNTAADRGDIEYTYSENVANTDYERVMREYAEQGQQLIVGEVFGLERAARKVAKDYQNTAFLMGSSFGGVGPSGMGAYHGYDGFKNFSHKRSVLKGQNILDAGKMITAPFTESTEKNIKRLT